jgi:ribosomal protein L11 methyltransferase
MNSAGIHRCVPEQAPSAHPPAELYIYYLAGRLKNDRQMSGRSFLGNWEEQGCTFLFFSEPSLATVEKLVAEQPDLTILDKYHMSYEQWQGGVLAPFSAAGVRIVPSWAHEDADDNPQTILLDPGVVFGNGLHPTTRDCLKALETVYARAMPATVLDIGTGSGVLALVAARLGGRKVLAVDRNLLAARTAHANVRRNGLQDCILVTQGLAEECIAARAELMIANIHYDVMRRLVRSAGFGMKKWFVLSGLLRSQALELSEYLANRQLIIHRQWTHEGIWHTLMGEIR